MLRGLGRRRAVTGAVVVAVALLGGQAAAHSFPGWSGTSGPFAWEAKRLSCGVGGEQPTSLRAHSRWSTSPSNGFQRVTFTRQIRDELTGEWVTVQRQRHSTRNTRLEGVQTILHWSQRFSFPGGAGQRSRHLVRFEWLRDRQGPVDRLVAARLMTLRPCVVG
jgi:hypothetical protein